MPRTLEVRLIAATVALALVSGCGTPAPTVPTEPTAPSAPTSAAASFVTVATPAPAGSGVAPSIEVDQSLLDVLPDTVDGVPLEFSAEASADVATDPGLVGQVEAIAYAVAPSPSTEDLLVVALGRLRDGVFDDGFFRSWRDAYDREVCAQAGGVRGNAESQIDGRTVFIGSCANGGHTYHVWLEDRLIVLSAASFGEGRLGERLVNDLRE